MIFNSIDFAIFLPIVFILYWFVTNKYLKLQNLLIVASSYLFYGWWDWRFLSLILFSTIVDYTVGQKLRNEERLTLVLKGDKTIVANSRKVYVNRTGNPGMATAGTGDVLTGIIASLIGQGYDVFDASQLGVYIHGLAGDIAAKKKGEHSMIASDIIEYLPDAFIKYNKEKGWNK